MVFWCWRWWRVVQSMLTRKLVWIEGAPPIVVLFCRDFIDPDGKPWRVNIFWARLRSIMIKGVKLAHKFQFT